MQRLLLPLLVALLALGSAAQAQLSNYTFKGQVITTDPVTNLVWTARPVGYANTYDERSLEVCSIDLDSPSSPTCTTYLDVGFNNRVSPKDIVAYDGEVYVAANVIGPLSGSENAEHGLVLRVSTGSTFPISGYRCGTAAIDIEPITGEVGVTGWYDSDTSSNSADLDGYVLLLKSDFSSWFSGDTGAPTYTRKFKNGTDDDQGVDIKLRREYGTKPNQSTPVEHTAVYVGATAHGGSAAPRYWIAKLVKAVGGGANDGWWWSGTVGTYVTGSSALTAIDLQPHDDEGIDPVPSEDSILYVTGYRPGPTSGDTDWATYKTQYAYAASPPALGTLNVTGPWTQDGYHDIETPFGEYVTTYDKPMYLDAIKDSGGNYRVIVAGTSNPTTTWYRRGLVKTYSTTGTLIGDTWLNGGNPSHDLMPFGLDYDPGTNKLISATVRESNRQNPKYYEFSQGSSSVTSVSSSTNITAWGMSIDKSTGNVCGVGVLGANVWVR